jgi:hypothetical protein
MAEAYCATNRRRQSRAARRTAVSAVRTEYDTLEGYLEYTSIDGAV